MGRAGWVVGELLARLTTVNWTLGTPPCTFEHSLLPRPFPTGSAAPPPSPASLPRHLRDGCDAAAHFVQAEVQQVVAIQLNGALWE